ncbi:MAG TPA: RNA polymerase sigma factor [Polyangiaceae bacterium]
MADSEASDPTSPEVTARLVANHRAFLSFVERRVGSRSAAEDIVQQAFARGLEHLPELRDGEAALGWFYRVLRHAVIDHHRRRKSSDKKLEALAAELETDEVPAPDLKNEVCRCVGDLAKTLKPEYAEILLEVDVEGLPVGEYAKRAGISSGNAAVRAFRARNALRLQVARCCGTCAEHGCLDCTCQPRAVSSGRSEE